MEMKAEIIETICIGIVAGNMGYGSGEKMIKTGKALFEYIGRLTYKEIKLIKECIKVRESKHRQYSAYLSNGGTMTMEEWEGDGRWDKSL